MCIVKASVKGFKGSYICIVDIHLLKAPSSLFGGDTTEYETLIEKHQALYEAKNVIKL